MSDMWKNLSSLNNEGGVIFMVLGKKLAYVFVVKLW